MDPTTEFFRRLSIEIMEARKNFIRTEAEEILAEVLDELDGEFETSVVVERKAMLQ